MVNRHQYLTDQFQKGECGSSPIFNKVERDGLCLRNSDSGDVWFPKCRGEDGFDPNLLVDGFKECTRYDDVFDYDYLDRRYDEAETQLGLDQRRAARAPCCVSKALREREQMRCCLGTRLPEECPRTYLPRFEGKERCESLFGNFCGKHENLLDWKCRRFKEIDEKRYYDAYSKACFTAGKSGSEQDAHLKKIFSDTRCGEICSSVASNGEYASRCRRVAEEFCKDKETDERWSDACACYFPESSGVYAKFREEFTKRWQVKDEDMAQFRRPECFFPPCIRSSYRPDTSRCPSLSINSCVTSVDVRAKGARIDHSDFVLKNENGCRSKYRRNNDSKDLDDPEKEEESGQTNADTSQLLYLVAAVAMLILLLLSGALLLILS
jgi:hypothetical protein